MTDTKCDRCGGDEPIVHLTEVRDGQQTQRRLCLPCTTHNLSQAGVWADMTDALEDALSPQHAPRRNRQAETNVAAWPA